MPQFARSHPAFGRRRRAALRAAAGNQPERDRSESLNQPHSTRSTGWGTLPRNWPGRRGQRRSGGASTDRRGRRLPLTLWDWSPVLLTASIRGRMVSAPWMAPAWKGLMLITSGVPCRFRATIVCSMDHAALLSSIRSTSTRAVTCSQRQSLLVGDGLARWVRSDLARCIGSLMIRRYRCE